MGSVVEEVCDMLGANKEVPEVQEAGFKVLSGFCESIGKKVILFSIAHPASILASKWRP